MKGRGSRIQNIIDTEITLLGMKISDRMAVSLHDNKYRPGKVKIIPTRPRWIFETTPSSMRTAMSPKGSTTPIIM